MPSDSKNDFGFVVDELSELVLGLCQTVVALEVFPLVKFDLFFLAPFLPGGRRVVFAIIGMLVSM